MNIEKLDALNMNLLILPLTKEYCAEHYVEILSLINTIPHICWTEDDLFSDNDYYGNKWRDSYVVIDNRSGIIGILISYFRMADDRHILDSVYIHKLAIQEEYKNKGIGSRLLQRMITNCFQRMQWLWNITVQTNDCEENQRVIHFYQKNGFKYLYSIKYPDKKDMLMLVERSQYPPETLLPCITGSSYLFHPRLGNLLSLSAGTTIMPTLYFSTTNVYKRNIVQFILHNYNINTTFVTQSYPITEPQIERADVEEELNLVRFPLKNISRFISKTPYVIEDSMLFVEYFNRNGSAWELPGADTKRWWRQLGAEGMLAILSNSKQRNAKFVSQTGAFVKANEYYFGRGELKGQITHSLPTVLASGAGTYPHFFHRIFVPEGASKTLAEMDMYEFAKYDYIRKALLELLSQLSWSYTFFHSYTDLEDV